MGLKMLWDIFLKLKRNIHGIRKQKAAVVGGLHMLRPLADTQ
jgi:hypothetical protein